MGRRIAVFTGNRAEYGLLRPIIEKIQSDPDLSLQLLVAGGHLDNNFGRTLTDIQQAGFPISAEIAIDLKNDDLFSTAVAVGDGIKSIAHELARLKPDMLMVYADRFEGFSAVIAASQMCIPVAHLEGGDMTEGGALDDSVRHAMTKLSHLHFTTNEVASKNVIQMGESKERVFTVGLPSIDAIVKGDLASKEEIAEAWGLSTRKPLIVFTQHSVTNAFDQAENQIRASLAALESFLVREIQVCITYPNNDAGGARIIGELKRFAEKFEDNLVLVPSLGGRMYHGILALARSINNRVACVGNSSSGIKETPIFGCPTVNIGSRQAGRLRAGNVIDVDYDTRAISIAIEKCLFDDAFRQHCQQVANPYGNGQAAIKIVDVLKSVNLDANFVAKKHHFYAAD